MKWILMVIFMVSSIYAADFTDVSQAEQTREKLREKVIVERTRQAKYNSLGQKLRFLEEHSDKLSAEYKATLVSEINALCKDKDIDISDNIDAVSP